MGLLRCPKLPTGKSLNEEPKLDLNIWESAENTPEEESANPVAPRRLSSKLEFKSVEERPDNFVGSKDSLLQLFAFTFKTLSDPIGIAEEAALGVSTSGGGKGGGGCSDTTGKRTQSLVFDI